MTTMEKGGYRIAVPTYRRAEAFKSKTWAHLMSEGYSPDEVDVFVANEDELSEYKAQIPEAVIRVAKPGLQAARSYILKEYYEDGEAVVMLDDDLAGWMDKGKNDARLKRIAAEGFRACKVSGARMWGLSPTANAFYMKDTVRTAGLWFLIGQTMGFVVDRRLGVDLPLKEDYELTLRYYNAHGAVVRLDGYASRSKVYSGAGGLQALFPGKERAAVASSCARALISAFPGQVKAKGVRDGHIELALEKKAAPVSQLAFQRLEVAS